MKAGTPNRNLLRGDDEIIGSRNENSTKKLVYIFFH